MEKGPFALGGKLPYLAVFILSSNFLSTQAQVTKYNLPVFMNPSNAIEGQGINLTIGSASTAFIICNWYRGADSQKNLIVTVYLPPLSGNVFGSAYTGRETAGPNCSLHIENLNQDDSGTYTVTKDGPSVHGKGELSVEVLAPGLLPKPSMSIVQLFRENMDSVHLKCDTTVRFANISWLQNGKPLNACRRIQLSNNNQTLTIQPVLRRDAGAYQCHISNPLSGQRSDTTTISVIYGPDAPVIKMTAKFLTQPSNRRLNCKASSFPEAEYRWFHNGKEFSKNTEVLLKNIQSGTFTCQATNPFTQRKENTTLEIDFTSLKHLIPWAGVFGFVLMRGNMKHEARSTKHEARSTKHEAQSTKHKAQRRRHQPEDDEWDFNEWDEWEDDDFHTAQAEEPIPFVVVPPEPMENGEVLLIPLLLPNDTISCTWLRKLSGAQAQIIVTVVLLPPGSNTTGPGYTWRETAYPNCSLRIKPLGLNDTATYTLVAGGATSSNSGNVSLKVQEYVPEPVVTITPTPFLVESQSVQLHCDTPITQNVSWLKDGKPLHPGYSLTDSNRTLSIDSVTRNDTGDYQCRVSNGIIEVTSKAEHLSVIYGPEVPVIRPNNACNERHINIILTCRAASYPEPQYTWFRNGVRIDSGPKLFIENFNENQTGIYVCEAMNELLQKRLRSDVQHIRLKESCVSDVNISGSSEGIEGRNISLNCTAKGDEVQYSWMKENQPVNEDERISFANNNQTLNFHPCHRTDAAKYKCHAHNNYSSDESDFFGLSIVYGPDAPFINETVDINQEKISLTCVAVAFPATENKWFFNGEPVLDNPKVFVLEIFSKNSGNYTCQATNPRSNLTLETSLEIDMIERRTSLRRR
ncbi:carcinoembryonic antigen-related cell adhesion molecule 5-like [Pantherophis guttatus]|uniref:Carcinoembryonic antigen-related cell adhesion molecule 5-like n=1 Tax=Pantherophis guttatus TaxID=94885 RepID=A0ABM3ZNR1_PANGU|nr:carcinoembryonic antigen-related cell adhesion molecule 5-like [Pantherophis guttatus]